MPLQIDTSRALRMHRQLTELVSAILTAPDAEPETYAVEWKSNLDLTAVEHRFTLAKAVIAFSNRHPDDADREFEGCAYIVVGAVPQGTPPDSPVHDPAVLDDWIVPFVGSDGPRWRGDYVRALERDILVITVEAPRWGDPIHVLEKGYGRFNAGRAFVRRQGKSVEADPDEMRMLQERLKRTASRITVDVEFEGDRPRLLTYTTTAANEWAAWIGSERRRLYAPIAPPAPAEMPVDSSQFTPIAGLAEIAKIAERFAPSDHRSRKTYEWEVEAYLAGARATWQRAIWESVIEQKLAELKLCLKNSTDENYEAVQVVLNLPAATYAFTEDTPPRDVLDAPVPPAPWGTFDPGILDLDLTRPPIPYGRGEFATVTTGDKWTVTLPAVHLRPHATVSLPTVSLAIPAGLHEDEQEIQLGWSATSTSAAGRATRMLTIPLVPGPVNVSMDGA